MSLFPALKATFYQTDFSSGQADTAFKLLWQQGQHQQFVGTAGCRLHYSCWQPELARAALLLVPGRIEAGHKYAEFIADALSCGYQVFVLDHRGQGASQRLLSDGQLGYVDNFDDYASDLKLFVDTIIQPACSLPLLAVAHSMGGAILARYLQQQSVTAVKAAVFSSPMWGINTSPLPAAIAPLVVKMMCAVNGTLSNKLWYLPGQGPYQNRPFLNNDLSHCAERYQWFRELYQQYPLYQLGGVSWHWLAEALQACTQLKQRRAPQIPCFLLRGAEDTVIDNRQQLLLWQQWQQQQPLLPAVTIAGARHELLTETDEIRALWFTAVNQFLLQVADIPAQAPQKQDQHE